GEAWNFGPNSYDERSVEYLVKTLCALWPDAGAQYRIESGTADLHEAAYLKLDCSKARQELGWQPVWSLEKALQATKRYHTEMLQRLATGEDPEVIAREKAEWVNSLTDIQPFEAMLALSKLLLKRSQKAGDKEIPFTI
ncbi:MAG TPA: hypothetical protein PKJ77_07155, partial [Thermodesulfobacteriota bacterium]|nr:hypothetical protein [Thermodesulfobacteriota bacterium]